MHAIEWLGSQSPLHEAATLVHNSHPGMPVTCCICYAGMSDFGITTWAQQPYSHDFAVGSNRPRKVISVDAMDAAADWPTRIEELRFDPQDVSDPTWHR